jgi:hypothetical protein
LLRIASHEVMVSVDEAGDGGHAASINDLHAASVWRAGGNGDKLSAANDDRTILNDVTIAHDDADIGDRQVLRREMRGASHAHKKNQSDKSKESVHCFSLDSGFLLLTAWMATLTQTWDGL